MNEQLRCLRELLSVAPKDGREMVLLIRRIIHDWVNAGLPYPIDDLDVLVGIESQSDHLLGGQPIRVFGSGPELRGSKTEEDELTDLYDFFLPRYTVAQNRLIERLNFEIPRDICDDAP
jgi:hypothetical protein